MYRTLLIVVSSCATLVVAFCVAGESSPQDAAVVILRNGNFLRGHVTNLGDRYLVKLPSGADVQVSTKRVDFVSRTLDDAYRRIRDAKPPTIRNRLALAQWCIRVKLYARAADQLLALRNADPRSRQLHQLEQRLAALVQDSVRASHASASGKSRTPTTSQRSTKRKVSPLPPGAVQQFTSTIQPILLNRCSANACHGSTTSSRFRLIRPAKGYLLKRRATQRNLRAALRWIDRENPASSPLLNVPNAPHGTAKTAVFESRFGAEQRNRLSQWIRSLSVPVKKTAAPAAIKKEKTTLSQPMEVDPEPEDLGSGEFQTDRKSKAYRAKDPFDPELFNRQFFPDGDKNKKSSKKGKPRSGDSI